MSMHCGLLCVVVCMLCVPVCVSRTRKLSRLLTMCLSSVVLPAPRKPDRSVTGSGPLLDGGWRSASATFRCSSVVMVAATRSVSGVVLFGAC